MSTTQTTRATIFLRLKSDDSSTREIAWSDFRSRYAPVIAGFAIKLGVKTQDIDDIIQDVMLGFFSHAPTFTYDPTKGRFRGYLKVCTFRAMQRRLGGKARLNQVPIDQVDPADMEVEQVWADIWEQQRIERALEETRRAFGDDPAFRAFELLAIKGLPVHKVSSALGMSESTLRRARAKVAASLKRRLADLEDLEG
jgi:RNA polymerase sigma-70 factor (ECF subfamily)